MVVINSVIDTGSTGTIIKVECHLANSLPNIVIVGVAHRSVDEAKERIRGALTQSGIKIPRKRIILNLAPADIPKAGTSFDLPMLIAILCSASLIRNEPKTDTVIMGEVGLDGTIRPIRGVIGKILTAKRHGITKCWIPEDNLAQAMLVPGISLRTFRTVSQLFKELNAPHEIEDICSSENQTLFERRRAKEYYPTTIDDVVGQEQAKRALLIAATGQHNILLSGEPGIGKSLLSKALLSIMPPLKEHEILDVTHLHSLASKSFDRIITNRPFRAPHHGASQTSILGGGTNPRPGEISLSHNGILFFDEFPEFSRSVIEALRQPLEDKKITVARSKESVDFPANFLFVATSNPCPCGFYGSSKDCRCSPVQIQQYQRKLSGPIVDRIDLFIELEPVPHHRLMKSRESNLTPEYKNLVTETRHCQIKRSGKLNNELTHRELEVGALIKKEAVDLLNTASSKLKLSARSYVRSLRVSRTIADLDKSDCIETQHIAEALQYRRRVGGLTSDS